MAEAQGHQDEFDLLRSSIAASDAARSATLQAHEAELARALMTSFTWSAPALYVAEGPGRSRDINFNLAQLFLNCELDSNASVTLAMQAYYKQASTTLRGVLELSLWASLFQPGGPVGPVGPGERTPWFKDLARDFLNGTAARAYAGAFATHPALAGLVSLDDTMALYSRLSKAPHNHPAASNFKQWREEFQPTYDTEAFRRWVKDYRRVQRCGLLWSALAFPLLYTWTRSSPHFLGKHGVAWDTVLTRSQHRYLVRRSRPHERLKHLW